MSANPPAGAQARSELKARKEAERSGQPFLVYRDDDDKQQLFSFEPGLTQATVGRQSSSDLVLVWDEQVSRLHAQFERVEEDWTVVDDGRSRNGTFVNGERLTGRHRLADGDTVRFGATTMTFRSPSVEELRPPDLGARAMGPVLPPGSTIAGYEIEGVVGSGGMGVLYRARQVRLDRLVALKLVEPEVAGEPVVRERLRREARTVAALDHPNVVPLYEAGEEDGRVFIVTRWVDGTELGTLIRRDGPLEPARAARIAAQIASALEVAHEKGLIHRDVKPSNVILTSADHAYLTDFGLTKRVGSASGLTAAGQMLGTIDYVAPEQIEGNEPDARGDVYGLACVLFETLAGTAPFAGESGGMAKMWAHVNAEPPSVREQRPDVPQALDDVILRALAKTPEGRPSAAAFGAAVLKAVGEAP